MPASVPDVRHAVVEHLRAARTSDPPLRDIALVVSEAVSNAVVHAYRDGEPGPVRVRVGADGDAIELMVQDQGCGMAPRPDSPGLGLGLPTMATLADRFEVRCAQPRGTRLCFWFDVEPPPADPAA